MKILTTSDTLDKLTVDGIVVGMFEDGTINSRVSLDISSFIEAADFVPKPEKTLLLLAVEGVNAKKVLVVGLGERGAHDSENARKAAGVGCKKLRDLGARSIALESFGFPQAVAEGAILGLYRFDELKTQDTEQRKEVEQLYFSGNEDEFSSWNEGTITAEVQNWARRMGELPANIATPTYFVEETERQFKGLENVKVHVYDEKWAEKQKMGAFLSVTRGSHEPAKFLVIEYTGAEKDDRPIAIVGKGITFDTGGISLKGSSGMGAMRGDCSGAAATIATLLGVAKLKLKANLVGITPLTENMPGGSATKPSDVVFASNGKSIEVDNTDAEGRMILSDALVYAEKKYAPHTIIDIATLTGAMMIALGEHYIGAFSRSDELWEELNSAGKETAELFWRMPLDSRYKKQLKSQLADLKNVGGRPAGSITAAVFLSEFVDCERWVHLDIAGSAWASGDTAYKIKGNTGIPVRALIQFVKNKS